MCWLTIRVTSENTFRHFGSRYALPHQGSHGIILVLCLRGRVWPRQIGTTPTRRGNQVAGVKGFMSASESGASVELDSWRRPQLPAFARISFAGVTTAPNFVVRPFRVVPPEVKAWHYICKQP
jgi:hypothetical protein